MSLFDDLDLGANDYSESDKSPYNQFVSKPSQRPYQPFGGPIQQDIQPYAEEPALPEYEPEPVIGGGYESPFDEDLDVYDQAKKQYSYISRDASAHSASAKLYEDRYEDFKKNKFLPFYRQFDEFGDFETDDEYAASLDSLYENDLKTSKEADGFLGESDGKKLAKARLGKYVAWNQPNGLRDQFLRLKKEKENRRLLADQSEAQKAALMDSMTAIPMQTRMAMDNALKSRGSSVKSKKSVDEMLNQFKWEKPVIDLDTGEVTNLDRVDPRREISSIPDLDTGKQTKSYEAQRKRLAAALKGDIDSVLAKRDLTAKERKLRDKGIMFSQQGLMDGRPLGLSRQDVDLLDLEKMQKAGMKSYKGRPLEEVLNELGGPERLEMAKVMQAVYAAKSAFEDAQLEYLNLAGGPKAEVSKKKMEQAREAVNKTIGLASQYGLDNELFEQAETTGWFAGLGNAIKRGLLMSEMSNYTPDFLTNTLDADEIQKFIDIASDIEDLPESSAMARYKKADNKSKNLAEALGKLVFNHADAIPELFLESMSSFLPATFKWGLASAGAGAVAGALKGSPGGIPGMLAGAKVGGSIGARSGWAIASFTLEASGSVLQSMQELGIDWKNPWIVAAAFDNETTRNQIIKRAYKKGVPIALLDGLSAGMAGKMAGLRQLGLNGGKLIDGASWAQNLKYASATAPRFTKWQRAGNVATEIGADSTLGMLGEYFGQAWSKESGEAWDWDAIAAEGVIGVGPGIAGGFLEQARGASNDFTSAPIQYSDQTNTPDGTSGTINRAGFKTPYRTFNSADGMTTGILNMAGIDSSNMADPENAPKVMAIQDWVANMWISNPQQMQNLRIVIADRTPFADMNNEGSFETDEDGNGVIYMNRQKFNQDPVGAFMHEAGHLARLSMFNNDELVDLYNGLSSEEKLSAFAEYYKRIPGRAISQYSPAEQAEIKKAYRKFVRQKGEIGAADEWFSFQFVRYLAGGQVDKSLKSDMQGWLQKYAFPFLEKFAGSENLGGSKKDILAARILSYMGRTPRGFDSAVNPNLQAPDMPGTETDFNAAGVRAPKGANVLGGLSDSEGLNHLVSRIVEEYDSPQEQARAASALNTFLDKNVLPTNISFWTKRERQNAADVQSESQKGPAEDRTFGERLAQEQRSVDELLARGRVEQMTEADFAEPEVTEFAEETDPKKKKEAEAARRRRQGSKKDSTKYPEGFDQNDTGARVGRSPRNIAREKEQYNILGKRFRVTLTMPGFRGDESRVEYFATRKEAEAAVKDFEKKQNLKHIEKVKRKHAKARSIISDSAKFEQAYDAATEKLGKDSSVNARIAEALNLSGLMSDSLFGSAYASKHLAEGKVHGGGVKGAVKAPSMREVQNDLFKSDQEHQDAVELLNNREAELVRQLNELEKIRAEIQGSKESTEQAPKESKEKDTYTVVKIVQLRKKKNKKDQYELYGLGKGNKIKKVKNVAQTKDIWPYLRKLNDTSQIEKGALAKVKSFKDRFEKQVGKYKGQLRYWLVTKKKGSGKKVETKKSTKKVEKQPSQLEDEIDDIKNTLKLVRDYREVLVPESKAFMWGELPHPSYFVDKEGKERLKLSVLAKGYKKITVYKKSGKTFKKEELSSPQATLVQFVKSYDGSKRKDFDFLKGTGLKPEEYAIHIDSVMAAALNPRDLQNKPMGEMSIDKDGNQKVKEYFGGFQVDKGTNYFLYAVTKALELERSRGNPTPLISENPTLDELAMYEVAGGKAYEDRGGDISGRKFYRYFGLVERMAKEADRKIRTLSEEYEKLDPKDPSRQGVMQSIKNLTDYKKKLFPSVDDIANIAEENQYFPKVQGGKMFSEAFSEWLYYDEMLKAIGSDIDSQPPDPGKKSYFDYVEGDLEGGLSPKINKIDTKEEDLRTRMDEKPDLKNQNAIDADASSLLEYLEMRRAEYKTAMELNNEKKNKFKKTQKPLFSREFPNLDLGPNEAESDFETNKDVFYVSPDGVAGNTLRSQGFDFRDIGIDPDDDIAPREGVHGGFKRRAVDQGFDIMAVLRSIAGAEGERLKTLVPSSYDTAFLTEFIKPEHKTQITVEYNGKDIKAEWRDDPAKPEGGYWVTGILAPNQPPETNPGFLQAINDTWMTQTDEKFLKPTSDAEMVTAAKIADFLYRGKSASDLGLIPSSKNKQDRTGAPGGGLLPFVFEAFIKDMYQKLNITDFETEVTVSEFMEPLASDMREFERDGKKVRLQIDANGQAALYEVNKSDDVSNKLNITKKELSELTQTHFGKDAKKVAEDLKSEPKAEGQKPKAAGVTKIISGGQNGADQAGLVAAEKLGITTGGTAPKGFETWGDQDESEVLKEFGLKEITDEQTKAYKKSNKKWGPRTEQNVINSDGTVLFGNEESPGSLLTIDHAKDHNKPYLINPTAEELRTWLAENDIKTLNVAGNREATNKGISKKTEDVLTEALSGEPASQKPKAAGQRQYSKVKQKYDAGKWFVNGELIERSLFAESGKHPEFDYMQSALAPIVQAVIDARRVDVFGTSERNENLIVPRDTQRAENESSDLVDDDAPEGSMADVETEPDTSKSQSKTVQGENEEVTASENPRGDEDAPLQQSTSTQADAFASKLSGTDTNKRLYNLKKNKKEPIDLLTIVKIFKDDPVLWEAFGMPTPKNNFMDEKLFDSYIKDLKKHPNYPAFEARILNPGTEALGSSFQSGGVGVGRTLKSTQSREQSPERLENEAANLANPETKTFRITESDGTVKEFSFDAEGLVEAGLIPRGIFEDGYEGAYARGVTESVKKIFQEVPRFSQALLDGSLTVNVLKGLIKDLQEKNQNQHAQDVAEIAAVFLNLVQRNPKAAKTMAQWNTSDYGDEKGAFGPTHAFFKEGTLRPLVPNAKHHITMNLLLLGRYGAAGSAHTFLHEILHSLHEGAGRSNPTYSLQELLQNNIQYAENAFYWDDYQKFLAEVGDISEFEYRKKKRKSKLDLEVRKLHAEIRQLWENQFGTPSLTKADGSYWLYDELEMMAGALTEPEVQQWLASQKLTEQAQESYSTLLGVKLDNMFELVMQFIARIIGIDPKNTALDLVVRAQAAYSEPFPNLPDGTPPDFSNLSMDPLGSSYALSSSIPQNSVEAVSMLTRLANRAGLSDENKEELKSFLKEQKGKISKLGIISAVMDTARPANDIITKALKDVGITDQDLLNKLDVKGLWQQYYGKTDEIVRQAALRFVEPIEDALLDHGITNEEFGKYLLARAAPSRNKHIKDLYEEYLADAKEAEAKQIQKMLDKYGDRMSGLSNELAIEVVRKMEQDPQFRAFLEDERNPLQKFYDLNREALMHRAEGGLMMTDAPGGINEEIAMVKASSSFNWKKDGGSEFMYQRNGAEDNYSYAPMQGFEGETQKLYDSERAYEVAGKSSTAAGRAWDMPKHQFLFKGSFGRLGEDAVAPDPAMVFPVAQSQYYEGAILAQKNEVSNSIGMVFEILRAVAYHGKEAPKGDIPYLDLNDIAGGKEILTNIEKDPSIIETTRELFEGPNAVFEKEFVDKMDKKYYSIKTKDVEVDNKKIDGLVMARREIDLEFQNNPAVFTYRQDGVPRYIKMRNNERGMRFAASVKNLRYETLPSILSGINSVTRFMASMFTSKNPSFLIPNFFRDLGTAAIHLTEDDKKEFAKNVFRPKRLKGFMVDGIFKVEQKKAGGKSTLMDLPKDKEAAKQYAQQLLADEDYEKMYQFAVQAGAKVGYFRLESPVEMIEKMQKLHAKGGKTKKEARGRWRQMVDTFDSINTAVENSIRMSAFWSAIEAGRTVHEAATISRNVTVDFNQKGTMTQTLGAFFVFFGASMNSVDRMIKTFQRRGLKKSGQFIGAMAAASFGLALFNRIMDDDEDEVEPGYDRIPSYRRDTMALFSTPGKENTGWFGIHLPLGYNMFWALGQTASDVFAKYVMDRGGSGSVDFIERNLASSLNAFNPIGGAGLATAFIPTPIKPIVEVWANQNFMGAPIRMEDREFEPPKPAHEMDPKRTQEHWTAFSKAVNTFMGGSDDVKGSVSGMFGNHPLKSLDDSDLRWNISGSQMEHILLGYTGGPGQIVNSLFGGLVWPGLPGTSENYGKFDANKIPITNRFYRSSTSDHSLKNMFYQIRNATKTAERAVRSAKPAGAVAYREMQKEMKDLLAMSQSIKYADALKSKIREQKKKTETSKNLTQDQKFQRLAELEMKEHDAYVKVIKKAQSLGIS